MAIFKDQMQRSVQINGTPKRIVSLVPSQTELLFDLGLEEQIVGITKFCIHPDKLFRTKKRVGGTKQYHFDRIEALEPDLIIGNKEENDQKQIEALAKIYPVWMSDIKTLEDALLMIRQLGEITETQNKAIAIANKIEASFQNFKPEERKSAAYFIWKNPYMVAGQATFIDEMLNKAGFVNVFKKERYPATTMEEIIALNPSCILLSSEPFPFKEKDIKEFQACLPNSKIFIVDGELFSWYGTRLLKSISYFKQLEMTLKD